MTDKKLHLTKKQREALWRGVHELQLLAETDDELYSRVANDALDAYEKLEAYLGGPAPIRIDSEGRRFYFCEDCDGHGFIGNIPEIPCEKCDREGEWFE